MEKKFLIILALIFLGTSANAEEMWTCKSEPYPIKGGASVFFSNITGANFISSQIVEGIIKKDLKNTTNSKFKVNFVPYSIGDLKDGKFKSLAVSADSVKMEGFYVSDFSARTACSYNQIIFDKKQEAKIVEDFLMDYEATITNDDLQKTLTESEFQKFVNALNVNVAGFNLLKIENAKMEVVNDKIKCSFSVLMPIFLASIRQNIVCEMGLKVENGKLAFADAKVNNTGTLAPNAVISILNKINPFMQRLQVAKNTEHIMKLNQVNIKDGRIKLAGTYIVPKNYSVTQTR